VLVLGTGFLLALLSAVLVLEGTSSIDRRAFASMRLRGIALARLLALASGESSDRSGAEGMKALLDRVTGDGELVYAEIVDREGVVVAEAGVPAARPVYAARFVAPARPAAGAPSLPRAPPARKHKIAGLGGEPLFLFTFPIELRRPEP